MKHAQLAQWVDMVKSKFGLEDYTCLETFATYEKNEWNETSYRFTSEWLPPGHSERKEDETNPEGTGVIELNAKTGRLTNVVFVGGRAPKHGFSFLSGDREEVIRFIEQETGWTYGSQFIDTRAETDSFTFDLAYKGVPVTPGGSVTVEMDEQKKLTLFSAYGLVPDEAEEAEFQLDAAALESLAKERLVFVEYPLMKEEKWLPLFMIDDVFVDNKTGKAVLQKQDILTWKSAKNQRVKRKLLQLGPAEIDEEELFQFPPHPDTKPLTKKTQAKVREAATTFLQTYVPKESGEWALSDISRTNGMVKARLVNTKDITVIPRMYDVFIDSDSYKVVHYVDKSSWMTDACAEFQKAAKPVLSKNEAFDKIKPHITVTPMYVYDGEKYRLNGKLDSHAAVHAATGEVLFL
ncbi:hypothetical protein [Domibacillus sp.]|uniref:hypothetical protein n=1 Tax=Domibacillus sp. TaxID=1969783 RepID=UPI002810AE06|nr:hypothetical protein [Domibacillus sp.]